MNTEPGDTWDLTWRYLGLDHRTWHYFMFFHVFDHIYIIYILACLNHSKPEQHKHRHRHPRSQPSSEDIGGVKQCKMQAKQCHNDCRVCFMMFNGLKSRAIFPPNKGTNQQLKDTQRLHCGSLWMVMGIECILCFDTSGSKSDSWNGVSEHDFVFFCPPCPPWLKCDMCSIPDLMPNLRFGRLFLLSRPNSRNEFNETQIAHL